MLTGAYIAAVAIAVIGGALAIYLERPWPYRALAKWWVSFVFGLAAAAGFQVATGRLPPINWPGLPIGVEPWEMLVAPLLLVSIVWPLMRELAFSAAGVRLLIAIALASLPLWSALPSGESYADVVPGNAAWALLALLAIGANYLAGEQLDASGAARWSLWVFVAQLFTVAALLMTCYGTLGEWCASSALVLGVLAASRLFVPQGTWAGALGLAATAMSCILLTHIRIYSSLALPAWLAPLPMLMPLIVWCVDHFFGKRRHGWWRVTTAAASAAILAVGIVATVLSLGAGGGDEWSASRRTHLDDQSLISLQLQ